MKYTSFVKVVLVSALFPALLFAESKVSNWNLPVELNDQNTTVKFEVDSTWHKVHGKTSGVHGSATLKKQDDPSSVAVQISIPVAQFDTDSSKRDKELREVMFASEYTEVKFVSTSLGKKCTPGIVLRDSSCEDLLKGKLTIVNTTSDVEIPVTVTVDKDKNFTVSGEFSIRWAEYGVEDPSILIAKVDPVATISFEVQLDKK